MKRTIFIYIISVLLFFMCKNRDGNNKAVIEHNNKKIIRKRVVSEEVKAKSVYNVRNKEESNKIKTDNFYVVQKGDTVWSIAERIAQKMYGRGYTRRDVGNIFLLINKLNYKNYPGGVNDNLRPGDKILIPE